MTRVFILAGVRIYREILATQLTASGSIEVAGGGPVEPDAETKIRALQPDVVLIDGSAPEALETARHLHQRIPEAALIALGIADSETARLRCAEAGMIGYVTEECVPADLISAIELAARGEAACSPKMAGDLIRRLATLTREREVPAPSAELTRREREIVSLLEQDLSNKEIALRLGIEVATVKNHVHNVLGKLGLSRRSELLNSPVRRHRQTNAS
jgi:DNA-binding NarL/FixJ family response regulator